MMTMTPTTFGITLDPRQTATQTQLKADEKLAAEQLRMGSISRTSAATVSVRPMDLKNFHMQQAADVGLLRPLWMEMMDMQPDTPRTRDLNRRNKKTEGFESVEPAKTLQDGGSAHTVDVFVE